MPAESLVEATGFASGKSTRGIELVATGATTGTSVLCEDPAIPGDPSRCDLTLLMISSKATFVSVFLLIAGDSFYGGRQGGWGILQGDFSSGESMGYQPHGLQKLKRFWGCMQHVGISNSENVITVFESLVITQSDTRVFTEQKHDMRFGEVELLYH